MRFMEAYVNFFSMISYWWMNWIFRLGYKRPVEIKDLGVLSKVQGAEYQRKIFMENMEKEQVSLFICW